jgi:hypothetical protein
VNLYTQVSEKCLNDFYRSWSDICNEVIDEYKKVIDEYKTKKTN